MRRSRPLVDASCSSADAPGKSKVGRRPGEGGTGLLRLPRRQAGLGVALAGALLFACSPAQASTVGTESIIQYKAGPREVNHLTITSSGGTVSIRDSAPITSAPGCRRPNRADRRFVTCGWSWLDHCTVEIDLGDRNDTATITMREPSNPDLGAPCPEVADGPGDDVVNGPPTGSVFQPLTINAGPGNDLYRRVQGVAGTGAGNDVIYGTAGYDNLRGGVGNDRLYGEGGNDILFGGSGVDRLYGGPGTDRLDGVVGDFKRG